MIGADTGRMFPRAEAAPLRTCSFVYFKAWINAGIAGSPISLRESIALERTWLLVEISARIRAGIDPWWSAADPCSSARTLDSSHSADQRNENWSAGIFRLATPGASS